jgi:hypothetical protein
MENTTIDEEDIDYLDWVVDDNEEIKPHRQTYAEYVQERLEMEKKLKN